MLVSTGEGDKLLNISVTAKATRPPQVDPRAGEGRAHLVGLKNSEVRKIKLFPDVTPLSPATTDILQFGENPFWGNEMEV